MDVGRYLVEAHLREGRPIADLARVHGVHRSWLYKLRRRFRTEGDAGLVARSRRPHRSPAAVAEEVHEAIVALRAQLLAEGLDAGALTIQWHLERRLGRAPSVSSIWRILPAAVWWCPSRTSARADRSSASKPSCPISSGRPMPRTGCWPTDRRSRS